MSKKKRKAEEAMNRRFKPPEDNEMRQKLRASHQATRSATEEDSRPPSQARGEESRAASQNPDNPSETESVTDEESDPTASESYPCR